MLRVERESKEYDKMKFLVTDNVVCRHGYKLKIKEMVKSRQEPKYSELKQTSF
jgi:hypothetical protein